MANLQDTTVTGDISVTGTVDGRDVATDGTKLDGIESSADVTDATNVAAAGALMDSECVGLAAVKATTGTFLTADQTKLDGIETGATADQTASQIKTLLEDGIDSVHYVNASIDNEHLADDAVGVAELSATGTASGSTFLRGDNAWSSVTKSNVGLGNVDNDSTSTIRGTLSASNLSSGTTPNARYGTPTFDGSNITNVVKPLKLTADGAISNGDKLIIQTDGTVKKVTADTITEALPSGSSVSLGADGGIAGGEMSVSWDSQVPNKVVATYIRSGYGRAKVGTLSGSTLSWGSESTYNSAATKFAVCAHDSQTAGKCCVAFQDDGNYGRGKTCVGTIASSGTGTTISWGGENQFHESMGGHGDADWIAICADPNTAGKFLINFCASSYAKCLIATGGGSSFGGVVTWHSYTSNYASCAANKASPDQFVVTCRGQSDTGRAAALTVSGSTITAGSVIQFNGSVSEYTAVAGDYNTADKYLVCSQGSGNGGQMAVLTVSSGTTLSAGSLVTFNSTNGVAYMSCAADPLSAGKYMIAAVASNNVYLYNVSVSGTTPSVSSSGSFGGNAENTGIDITPHAAQKGQLVVVYSHTWSGTQGSYSGQIGTVAYNLNAGNFIGIADAAYSDGATVTIQTIGQIDDAQSSLTAGTKYYVQGDNTLAATADTAGSGFSVVAGVALSGTKLLIQG